MKRTTKKHPLTKEQKRARRRVRARHRKALAEAGGFDVRKILESIATDTKASAASRISACKVLSVLGVSSAKPKRDEKDDDSVNDLALRLMGRGH
jgi:allophanate hydrolase subunit 2